VLIRGFGLPHGSAYEQEYNSAVPGHIFNPPGYIASSYGQAYDKDENEQLGKTGSGMVIAKPGYQQSHGWKWRIHCPAGSKLVHVDGVIDKKTQPTAKSEREILINKNSKFRLLGPIKVVGGEKYQDVELLPD
jgi:hypothetical protein